MFQGDIFYFVLRIEDGRIKFITKFSVNRWQLELSFIRKNIIKGLKIVKKR
jgi:hypothetical protein